MKLNKVLALALSGMLAGCKGGSANGEQDDVVVTPTASNAVTIMNNMQSKVKFEADAALDGYLAAAVKGLESTDIKDAPAVPDVVSNASSELYKAAQKILPGGYSLSNQDFVFNKQCTTKDVTNTRTVLYWVKAANLNEENVLTLVANDMQTGKYDDISTNSSKDYAIDYTGAVSIVKATATSEGGDTYNTYVVAVRVNQVVSGTEMTDGSNT